MKKLLNIQQETDIKIKETSTRDIAIIGVSLKLADYEDTEKFWDDLVSATDRIRTIPEQRKKDAEAILRFKGQGSQNLQYREMAYLDRIDEFDYRFFHLSPKEAEMMDPNQRLFMQTAWKALEDAGYGGTSLKGERVGVFLGMSSVFDYLELAYQAFQEDAEQTFLSNVPSNIATRLSYILNWRGPALMVDTACSSSLTAVHLACQALRANECKLALVGTVKTVLLPVDYGKIEIDSSDGRTRTFDDSSDGTGGGEGVIAVLLKPLHQALKDEDTICAVIKGSAVNNDGNSAGMTVPNAEAQAELIDQAWKDAGIDPRTIRFIEAHGTGTRLGDPIEIDGITKAFAKYTEEKQFCAVGSVKTNFGHLDNAAGLIGLVKAALSLQKKKIPPLAHFKKPNSNIPFKDSPVFPADRLIELGEAGETLRCGVSSFGLSGINCHIVMEEAPVLKKTNDSPKVFHTFEKKRCWIKLPETPYETDMSTVFIKQRLAETPGQIIYGISLDHRIDWLLNEHKVQGQTCLVGTAYFQLLSEVAKKQGYNCPIEIRDLFWENLLVITPEEMRTSPDRLMVILKDNPKDFTASILRKQQNGTWIQYASAEIKTAPGEKPGYLEIEKIKARCEERDPGEYKLDNSDQTLVEVSRRWYCMEKTWKNKEEQLSLLRLNDDFKQDLNRFEFHPPLLDAALSSGLEEPGFLPMMCESTKLYRPIRSEAYSYIRKHESDSSEVQKHDVIVSDVDGRINAEFNGLTFKRVQKECQLMGVTWIPEKIEYSQMPGELCVIGKSEPLKQIKTFELPHTDEERLALIESLEQQEISKIIYSSSLSSQACCSLDELETRLKQSVYNLFQLAKALIKNKYPHPLEILVVGKDTYSVTNKEININPENAALAGLVKVIHQENDNIGCKYLDIDDSTTSEQIIGEFSGFDSPVRPVAYRNGIRYVEDFKIIRTEDTRIDIKKQGVYLITGGLGGIGIEMAKYLATQNRVKLVLIGRAGLPPRESWPEISKEESKQAGKIHALLEIEQSGSKVLVISADVSNPVQMKKAIKEVHENFGKIDGVIHSAGIAGEGFLFKKEEDTFINVIRPKIQGTWILDRLTREDTPDFFILCSALTALTGAVGQGDYTAANAYLDAFAALRNREGHKTLSINWPAWKETGMAFEWGVNQAQYSIKTQDALDALHKLLSYDGSQGIIFPPGVKTEDLFRLSEDKKNTGKESDTLEKPGNVILSGRDDGKYSSMETGVAQVWAEVLGYDEISVKDDYYELGGDSIDANKIKNKIDEKLNIIVSIEDIFKYTTIEEYAAFIEKRHEVTDDRIPVEAIDIQPYYPVSAAQRRLYIICELSKESTGYNLPTILFIENRVDIKQLAIAFEKLIARHEPLRTFFEMKEDRLVQVIADQVDFSLKERSLKKSELEAYVQGFSRPFDLSKGPLLRAEVVTLDTGEHLLLFDVHHITADAFSLQIIFNELNSFYKNENLPELKIQYKDFAYWQNELFESEGFKAHENYWLQQFEKEIPVLDFPYDFQRPPIITYDGAVIDFTVDETLFLKVRQFSAKNETTPFTVFLTAFNILFHKCSRQDDITIAIADLGRNVPEVSNIIGMFINHLAIRAYPENDKTVTEFLAEIKELTVNAYTHQEYPFDRLIQKLNLPRDMSREPLTGITFSYMNFKQSEPDASELQFRPYEGTVKDSSKFDMSIFATEFPDRIVFAIEYYSAVYSESTMELFGSRFLKIVGEIVEKETVTIADIDILIEGEHEKIINDFNQTAAEYTNNKSIQNLFEAQVEKTPDAVALVFEQQQMTYRELNIKANQLAHYLQSMDVGPEVLVGICLERSPEMVIGLLGILKAGGAYLPLDPTYPDERLAFMIKDSGIRILITQKELQTKLNSIVDHEISIINIESVLNSQSSIVNRKSQNVNLQSSIVNPESLAYVIYTSGSTGKPKGVAIKHSSVTALMNWSKKIFTSEELTGVAASTSICFDLSVFEIFLPLNIGGCVILVTNALQLPSLPDDIKVTLINTVPSVINELANMNKIPASVQVVNLAGEDFNNDLLQKIYRFDTIKKIYNLYGPSEDTTYSTFALMKNEGNYAPAIGRPIDNTQIYILDYSCNPVPIGIPGELYIGGAGLARGYLNRPELTAEQFIINPFGDAGSRLYKSGDLARFLPDGNIEYLGRMDNQVKIRGFRIEILEIEAVLGKHPSISECAVLVRENIERKEKELVAYLVPEQEKIPDITELRNFLSKWLPGYMIPSYFMALDVMPLTPNGKMDRRALAKIDGNHIAPENSYVMPQTELEQQIALLWKKVLHVEKIGIHDNFFEVGGHSLLLLQLQQELHIILGKRPSMVDLFHYPTIYSLTAHLSGDEKTKKTAAAPSLSVTTKKEIAVIGMVGHFPGATDVESFWRNLRDGIESISFFSKEELLAEGIDQAFLENPAYVKANGVLEGIEFFDANFFGYSPREAEVIDPQQRLFLECAAEVIEHAGYDVDRIKCPVGIFAGAGMNTYLMNHLFPNREQLQSVGDYQLMFSNQNDFITTRASYKLNLKGPSVNIQTACSTSLVAVHLACQSLLSGECEMALAGGVSVKTQQKQGYLYVPDMILSPDGHCRAFDAGAQGTVGGNGIGIVMLKKLDQALADGDCIHAVIKGSSVNNDGVLKAGYTAPGVEGQIDVITEAMQGIDPETITYIETHGTGTALGDPIEIAALTRAYQAHTQKTQFCAIGSVKTNVGHLDTAAGIAGLIKTIQALKHKSLPPSLHFDQPNPEIDFANSPFYVNNKHTEWKSEGIPRRAGVSSFGIGGTNAHVVLEEAPEQLAAIHNPSCQVLLLSAKTESALEKATENLAAHFKQNPDLNLADAAFTLNTGRKAFKNRRMLVCKTVEEAIKILTTANGLWNRKCEESGRPVVFLFSGQGSQYINMASELYQHEPFFREQVDHCAKILTPLMGVDLRDILYHGKESMDQRSGKLKQTAVAQPSLFVIEYSLAQLWMAWGIHPTAMLGHSIGEYVAACLAGVFSLEEALELVAARGRLMQSLPGGAMLSVSLSEKEIQPFLNRNISLAAVNAPSLCVVSGTTESIDTLENELTLQEVNCLRLHTSHAFHSVMMEPILPTFLDCLKKIQLKAPQKPYLSNLSGTWITAGQATDANYWVQHLRFTVRFSEGMQLLLNQPKSVFLEVGPGRTLTTLAKRHSHLKEAPEAIFSLPSPKDPDSDHRVLLTTLGKLWLAGVSINWSSLYEKKKPLRLPLPTYPFERQRYWIESCEDQRQDFPVYRNKKEKLTDWFYVPSWKISAPLNLWLEERVLEPTCWLLFIDDCGLGEQLIGQLEGLEQEVMIVKMGNEWSKLSDKSYVLNPEKAEDYETLLNELGKIKKSPHTIVHMWSVTHDKNAGIETTEQAQNIGFYSLLFLAQALGKQEEHSALELIAISNNMQAVTGEENLYPEKATLLGSIKTIPHEYPNIRCRSVDVTLSVSKTGGEQRLIDQLLSEIITRTDDRIIAYRGKQRWLPSYEPIQLDQPEKEKKSLLKEKGTYLITGGLGGIGLTLAEFLAKNLSANLILLSRSSFPPRKDWDEWLSTHNTEEETSRKIQTLQALEKHGAQVLVVQADVTNLQQMQNFVTDVRERFGPIHGVIHAAGLPGGGVIQRKTKENAAAILAPKVMGSVVLGTIFKDEELDFFLLCSSVNSILEVFGQVDYCAANAFLDAYSEYLRMRGIPAISLNWDSWQEVGMAAKTPIPTASRERWEEDSQMGITPQEGSEVFRLVMESVLPRILVSTRKLIPLLEQNRIVGFPVPEQSRKKAGGIIQMHARPELTTPFVPPKTIMELSLTQIWQTLLGIEKVGIKDDFFALGGDSLLAIGLMSKIKQKFNKELSAATLYQAATVQEQSLLLERDKSIAWTPLVSIQPEGSKRPLFCLHPAGGHAMSYYALSQCLDKDQPLYGFQAYGLEEDQIPYSTAEEMAAFYLQILKTEFPQGPYQLVGWSFGGLIAFEMAQQFKARGDEVSFLALFDTQLSDKLTGEHMATEDNAEILVNVFSEITPGLSLEVLRQLEYDDQLRHVMEKSMENETIPLGTDFMTFKRLGEVLLTNRKIIQTYEPKVYDGKITFFQAAELGKGLNVKASLAWKQFSTEELDLHIIPGNHYVMVSPPQVEIVAEKLTRCMKQT